MSDQSRAEPEQSPEFQRFDDFVRKLVRVPVSEVRELDAQQKAERIKHDRSSEK